MKQHVAKTVLTTALQSGGDFAEIFYEDTQSNTLKYENGAVTEATSTLLSGAGIRILQGLQSVYGYTNDVSETGLTHLADQLSFRYQGQATTTLQPFVVEVGTRHGFKKSNKAVTQEEKLALVEKAYHAAKSVSPLVAKVMIVLLDTLQQVTIINNEGKWVEDQRHRVRMAIQAIASKNGMMEVGFEGPGALKGYEYYDEIDVEAIAKQVAFSAVEALDAKECPSSKMDVIIENGFGGVIFHEACGHSLEATSVAKNLSVFSNKLGQKIANEAVTAIDDGTLENFWGSGNYDDEGNPTRRNVLIEKGVLKSYLVDDQNGRRMKQKGNGACRRQSYKYAPTSRMSNTFIDNGPYTTQEIIQATKKGLYAKKMGGGSVNPITGEFNFAVQEAYLVEDGQIKERVKGATLIGNGAEVLLNIDMVGNNLLTAQGMCGSLSGSIPADVGQPCVRVRNITVGGRGGAQ